MLLFYVWLVCGCVCFFVMFCFSRWGGGGGGDTGSLKTLWSVRRNGKICIVCFSFNAYPATTISRRPLVFYPQWLTCLIPQVPTQKCHHCPQSASTWTPRLSRSMPSFEFHYLSDSTGTYAEMPPLPAVSINLNTKTVTVSAKLWIPVSISAKLWIPVCNVKGNIAACSNNLLCAVSMRLQLA